MTGFDRNRFIDLSERERKLLNCVICLNIFNDPIRSECDHTFCKSCIQQWIDSNHSTCPECRKGFTRKRRQQTDDNSVIIANHVFRRNLMANNFVNELKTKCDFEFNECPLIVEFGLLSAHIKQCEHRFCKTCELELDSNEHNCVEALKNRRNEDIKQQKEMFQSMINSLEEVILTNDNTMREMGEKISHLEKYKLISSFLITTTKQCLPFILKPVYVYLGSVKPYLTILRLNSETIILTMDVEDSNEFLMEDLSLDITDISEIMCCLDSTLPSIVFKPTTYGSQSINDYLAKNAISRNNSNRQKITNGYCKISLFFLYSENFFTS